MSSENASDSFASQEAYWGVSDDERFRQDKEFVQLLCNMKYLQFLAQNKYFQDEKFMLYLEYLRYWKQPEYCVLLSYPQCLAFLDNLIDNERFRTELMQPAFIDYAHQQQGFAWQLGYQPPTYSANTTK
jgi:mediator of RNA polymerase II transcription subunit 31